MPLPSPRKVKHIDTTTRRRLIIMSDAHRGDGTGADDFAQNSLLFKCALDYYLREGFTFIELGDAEELWEIKSFDQIYITHTSVYSKLQAFHHPDPDRTRYLKAWGNHDDSWEDNTAALNQLFPGIQIYEAFVLNNSILLWHGHQADDLCRGRAAKFSRFIVRHCWSKLQCLGLKDPTRAAGNPGLCNNIDDLLHSWADDNDRGIKLIIAGHTHRPVFENLSLTERIYLQSNLHTNAIRKKLHPEGSYFNTGSCVHPRCITGIEVVNEQGGLSISLIKWDYSASPKEQPPEAPDAFNLDIKRTVLECSPLPVATNQSYEAHDI